MTATARFWLGIRLRVLELAVLVPFVAVFVRFPGGFGAMEIWQIALWVLFVALLATKMLKLVAGLIGYASIRQSIRKRSEANGEA